MITKDELKREIDKIPDNLLEEAYALLKRVNQNKKNQGITRWDSWKKNLENFSADFMINRDQTIIQSRESFD
jgi:hypothetical protein